MNWFADCFTEAEVKSRYRDLCKIHHPDLGGMEETMKAVNLAYEERLRQKFNQTMSEDEAEEAVIMEMEVAAKVAEIIALKGIVIELVGKWIWVTGDTYSVRGVLKQAGFWFASKKRAWYFHTPEAACPSRAKKTLEQIRQKYGSRKVSGVRGSFLPA